MGKIANGPVVVTAHDPDPRGPWPVGTRWYLPRSWAADPVRRAKVRVPAAVAFAPKPELAWELLDQACAAGVQPGAVPADCAYGAVPAFLAGLEQRQAPYSVQVSRPCGVRWPAAVRAAAQPVPSGRRPGRQRKEGTGPAGPHGPRGRPRRHPHPVQLAPMHPAQALPTALPATAWNTVAVPDGAGPTRQRPACRTRAQRAQGEVTGPLGWLIGERPLPGDEGEPRGSFAWPRDQHPLGAPWPVADQRGAIERCHREGKPEVGRGADQDRTWPGRPRPLALVCLLWGYALLTAAEQRPSPAPGRFSPWAQAAGGPPPGLGPPRVAHPLSGRSGPGAGPDPRRGVLPVAGTLTMTPK